MCALLRMPRDIGDASSQQNGTVAVAVTDVFVFAPKFGQVSIANFAPGTDTIEVRKAVFADLKALLTATHDDASGNAVITDSAHDTMTLKGVTTLSSWHIRATSTLFEPNLRWS